MGTGRHSSSGDAQDGGALSEHPPRGKRRRRMPSTRHLRAADLDVVFQPIVRLRRAEGMPVGSTFGVEALARCHLPALPDAETLIETAVAEKAMKQLGVVIRRRAMARMPAVDLFLNVHPQELEEQRELRDAIASYEGKVWVEIPADALLGTQPRVREQAAELVRGGAARLVVDHVGAAPLDPLLLVQLRPDAVKLDRRLVTGLHQDPNRRLVATHLIELSLAIGARVIAVGVECEEDRSLLVALGVDLAQGFHLARPGFPLRDT